MMNLLSLFSGIGGFELGLERSGGFKTVAQCEIDPYCRAVLKKHWPEVPCYDDIRTLTAETLRRDGIAVDAICGGFPCQDVSFAGKRAGLDGERSGLWGEYSRLVRELRPRFVIVENTPGLLSLGMGRVLGDLAAFGYDCFWDSIPALAVGAPHERYRVWIVANATQERRGKTRRFRRTQSTERASSGSKTGVLAHDGQERVQRGCEKTASGLGAFSWCEDVRRLEELRDRSDLPPPIFRGNRDGVSNWVDRIGALGNAVVPQIPELIGRAILASMEAQS